MKGFFKTLLLTLLIVLVFLLLFSGVYAFFTFDSDLFIPNLERASFFNHIFITLHKFFLPAYFTGLLLAFSLKSSPSVSSGLALGKTYSSALVFILAVSLFHFLSGEFLLPSAISTNQRNITVSSQAQQLLLQYDMAIAQNNLSIARSQLQLYVQLDPENEDILEKLSMLPLDYIPESAKEEESKHITAELISWINLAFDFFESEDYFSAIFYANRALELRPLRSDLQKIVTQSMQHINQLALTEQNLQTRQQYKDKQEGLSFYSTGRFIEAYYHFSSLRDKYPDDKDIPIYLRNLGQELRESSFFFDEIESIYALSGINDIVFIDTKGSQYELIHIEKLIPTKTAYYVFGFEYLSFDPSGDSVYHSTAKYGKILDSGLLTVLCLDRYQDIAPYSENIIISGTSRDFDNLFRLNIRPDELVNFSRQRLQASAMNIAQLLKFAETAGQYGMIKTVYEVQAILRIVSPFSIIILSLLVANIGAAWYKKSKRYDIFVILAFPVFPILMYYLKEIWFYMSNLFYSSFLIHTGFFPSMLLVLLTQGILLFIFLYLLANKGFE